MFAYNEISIILQQNMTLLEEEEKNMEDLDIEENIQILIESKTAHHEITLIKLNKLFQSLDRERERKSIVMHTTCLC